ncbi:hypothetical protein KEM48_011265 [Puccinia striiformis f. sp. tritici PST-130]|nr:hypothetical protein KEM48_011265 [Puccinia striiformis f. sp. tritici PST-130]
MILFLIASIHLKNKGEKSKISSAEPLTPHSNTSCCRKLDPSSETKVIDYLVLRHETRGPRFDILAGPSLDELSRVKVNADRTGPLAIKTASFEGRSRCSDLRTTTGDIYRDTETNYFANWSDVTWSIQIQGRFLQPTSADDCVFGNTFDKPIRDRLPSETGAALKQSLTLIPLWRMILRR